MMALFLLEMPLPLIRSDAGVFVGLAELGEVFIEEVVNVAVVVGDTAVSHMVGMNCD